MTVIDVSWPPQREHRIASYNKGCRCDDCKLSNRQARQRHRDNERVARGRRDGDVMCIYCCGWFHPKGLPGHQARCEA